MMLEQNLRQAVGGFYIIESMSQIKWGLCPHTHAKGGIPPLESHY